MIRTVIILALSVLLTGCASTRELAPFRPNAVSIQLGAQPTITIHLEPRHGNCHARES